MIIIDTSIWIEFFKKNLKIFEPLKILLEKGEVIGIEWIFGELLQGVKNKREKELILEYWKNLPKIIDANIWIEAGIYSYEKKLISKGIGLIDAAIIMISKKYSARVWSLDKKINKILSKKEIFTM